MELDHGIDSGVTVLMLALVNEFFTLNLWIVGVTMITFGAFRMWRKA